MIITCPHCQTKYQVTFEAIGSAGRKVQCAHCRRAWDQGPIVPEAEPADASPEDDRLFDAIAEDALDEAMMAEAAAAAPAPAPARAVASAAEPPARPPDAAEIRKRQLAFSRRQSAVVSRLPLARLRRSARLAGLAVLAVVVAGAYFGREQIVERYPDLAGAFEAVGLGVNVVGLDFSGLETLRTLSGGKDVLMVSAQIMGMAATPRPVPPVVVSLLNAGGQSVYEWSVEPQVHDLMAGERATFDTTLAMPPNDAVAVRLSFAGGSGAASDTPAPEAEEHAADSHPAEPVAPSEPAAHADAAAEAHGAPAHH